MDISAYQHLNIRMSTRGKRPLRNLTPNDKVRAIQRIHNGETKASVSRDIGVPESTLRGWCKNEQKLRFMCRQMTAIEKLPNSGLENFQPAEKRNKFEQNFIINANSNHDGPMLGEMTITEFMKKTRLPTSESQTKRTSVTGDIKSSFGASPCSLSRAFSLIPSSANYNQSSFMHNDLNCVSSLNPSLLSMLDVNSYKWTSQKKINRVAETSQPHDTQRATYSMDQDFDKTPNTESIFNKKFSAVLPHRTKNSPEHSNTESSYTSGHKMEVNGRNILDFNCGGDINNNFAKLGQGAYIESLNKNTCVENNTMNNDIYRTTETTLLQWCKIFNASLNLLALMASTATLQTPVIYLQGTPDDTSNIKLEKKGDAEASTSAFGLRTSPTQNEMSNDSYYESEPEDLSIRSAEFKISTSINKRSQSPAKSTASSSSTQSDADA
ncbi:protein distal antenna-related [Anastrepha obliqua]|uniref:protein distal antenna-related n=1 Tax=Anastrepha obliqua TaxID=95512 RepID=UPI002409585D|nr:protein distal antenna-related [Anastrepha obliqua]